MAQNLKSTIETYMVEYIANTLRKKTNICSFTPNKKIQRNQKKLPIPVNCLQTAGNMK